MVIADSHAPHAYKGVMVSSTFTDLKEHRAALIKVIDGADLKSVVMENDSAKPDVDVVDSSLRMVQKSAAYIGVISHKYGQTPMCPRRNPDQLSITELEFDEAQKLKRPILLFIMGDDHPVTKNDIESDPAKLVKLNAFRERAKKMGPDTEVHRVYATFNNLEEFKEKAARSVADLRIYLAAHDAHPQPPNDGTRFALSSRNGNPDPIPKPPAFYAEPAYLGSHEFVGRRDQLETLNEWALPADAHPVLLFEAIGGTGKSMLTWEWARNHAPQVRQDWAGRFWYSFYERGAIMADFCQRALAYMTGQPLEDLRKKKTGELAPQLLHQLQAQPWLLILDGLERVLVAYHRIDAAQLRDEEAGKTDEIAQRDVCAAIRPEDDELLRALVAAAPSKLLLTSRLIPRVLLNKARQPIPGVQRVPLPGLRPADAEALFRACGVTGDSTAIQTYLKTHCDCHPLTIGVLAGLVKDYLPNRGNFDLWSADRQGGGRLNFADLDLVQKRNHILRAAFDALSPKRRQLLSMLSLLSEAVDYETLKALNPHLPPEIEEEPIPEEPGEKSWRWKYLSDDEKEEAQKDYPHALQRRADYEHAVQMRLRSPEYLAAPKGLGKTIKDLESRGLLQYDAQAKHYDLHPVVRGVASGGLAQTEKETYGQRVVDHFSSLPHNPYEQAETLEDVRDGLHVVRTLVQMGRFQEAARGYCDDLETALFINLEANAEVLALLRPFFTNGWQSLPQQVEKRYAASLANSAAIALGELRQLGEQLAAYGCSLSSNVELKMWQNVRTGLMNISNALGNQNRLAKQDLCLRQALEIASLSDDKVGLFVARYFRFATLSNLGLWAEAEAMWQSLNPMGREWPRKSYRPGTAEFRYAQARFWQGELREEELAQAEHFARDGRNRQVLRWIHGLRGEWHMERAEWVLAAESLHEAVRMARAVGQIDATSETQLAAAQFRLGLCANPRHEAEQLAQFEELAHRPLSELWLAIGDREQAKKHVLAAYRRAWADGEPFVHRYELNKSRALLEQLGEEIPNLPPYDPAKDEKLPWEDAVVAAIEELRAEKAAAKKATTKKSARKKAKSKQ